MILFGDGDHQLNQRQSTSNLGCPILVTPVSYT